MRLQICVIYDSKSETYDKPFLVRAKGEGMRAFGDLATNPEHDIGRHPDHYTLFYLGEYDPTTAEYFLVPKESLGNGLDIGRMISGGN